jgi:hypothetical protein
MSRRNDMNLVSMQILEGEVKLRDTSYLIAFMSIVYDEVRLR